MAVNPRTQGIIILALGRKTSSTSLQSLWNSAVFRQDDARNIAALVVGIHLCTKLPGKLGMRLSTNPPSWGTFFLLAEKYYQRSTKLGRFLEPVQKKSNCSWHVKVYQAWSTVWKLFFLLLISVFSLSSKKYEMALSLPSLVALVWWESKGGERMEIVLE